MKWLEEIHKKWAACIAHMFILHFNVDDTVDGQSTAAEYVMQLPLVAKRDIIIKYNRSSGFTFPIPSHRETLLKELGLPEAEVDNLGIDEVLPREPEAALAIIEAALKLQKKDSNGEPEAKTAVIIEYAETLVPNTEISQMSPADRTVLTTLRRWAKDRQISVLGSPIFLITENLTDIHPSLRAASSRVEAIQVPLPDMDERKAYIRALAQKSEVPVQVDEEQMSRLTAGLKKLHVEDIFLRAETDEISVTIELIKERKKDIIASEFGDVLEIIDPEHGFEILGGMEHVKEFFHNNVIKPLQQGNLRRCPMGVLLPGPPGTGKTVLAEAVAKESGVNCCSLNLAKISDKWVGSSERNLEKALQCIEALAPTIVIIDEIDQVGLSRDSSGDSGVSNRLFKRLLEFMSDSRHRGKVVFIGLTNRPDKMDAALKRPGRFDKKVPILTPNKEERAEILKMMFKKYDIKYLMSDEIIKEVAGEKTDGYTGAEIEALVLKATDVAEDRGDKYVDATHLFYACEVYRPTTQNINEMTKLALEECNDLELLPEEYRQQLKEKQHTTPLDYSRKRRTV